VDEEEEEEEEEHEEEKKAKLTSAKIYFMPALPLLSHSSQHKTGQYVLKMTQTC
jgi:CO dehydrogenase/acetyl-CoA synthase beta subunit